MIKVSVGQGSEFSETKKNKEVNFSSKSDGYWDVLNLKHLKSVKKLKTVEINIVKIYVL